MYHILKSQIKSILPQHRLIKYEPALRGLFGQFYRGSNCKCEICNHKLRKFIELDNKDLLCPFCGSLSRNRRLWNYLKINQLLHGKVLHFSPSRCLYRQFKLDNEIEYLSTDFEGEFLADYQFNITNIDCANNMFNLIICYHVLEHIDNDLLALQELYRVLHPTGTLLIQTPFKEGDIYENYSITDPTDRKKHFGQEDHVRIYSKDGLRSRLQTTGFHVEIVEFPSQITDSHFGLKSPETIFKCTINHK